MFTSRILRARTLAIFGLSLILAAVAYGFAASNTVPVSGAGDGDGTISGYTIGAVQYTLDSDPTLIDEVSFTVTPNGGAGAATVVKVSLVSGGGFFDCTLAGNTATCDIAGGVSVLAADELRVIAHQ